MDKMMPKMMILSVYDIFQMPTAQLQQLQVDECIINEYKICAFNIM